MVVPAEPAATKLGRPRAVCTAARCGLLEPGALRNAAHPGTNVLRIVAISGTRARSERDSEVFQRYPGVQRERELLIERGLVQEFP